MNKILYCISFFILLQGGYAQSPFNKIYDFGFYQNNAYALIEHDQHIYSIGQLVSEDSIPQSGIFFSKFDLSGNLIKTNQYVDTLSPFIFFININKNIVIIDDHLYVAPYEIDSYVIGCDLNLDSTFVISKFEDPLLPEVRNPLTGMVEFPVNKLAVCGITTSGPLERRGLITKVDPFLGKTEIDYIEMEGLWVSPYKLLKNKESLLVLGYANNLYDLDNIDTLDFGIFIIEYDNDFEKTKELFFTDSFFDSGRIFDALIDSNNNTIISTVEFVIDTIPITNQWRPRYRSSIVKVDEEFNLKWIKPLVESEFKEEYEKYHSICESHLNDGYVLVGESEVISGVRSAGALLKVGSNGEKIWRRVVDTLDENDNNDLNDIIKSSDGFYFAIGIRKGRLDNDSISSLTQAWLIKFDENGDIVDLETSTDNTIALDIDVKIFPNPSSDYIYIEQKNVGNLNYRLYNSNGELLVSRDKAESYHTFILDVSGDASGLYFLEIVDQNTGRIYTEQIVVE